MVQPQVIEHVTVVGTGVIGSAWCARYASRGLHVVATDPAAGAESRLRRRLDELTADIDRLGTASGSGSVRFTADLGTALHDTQFVQECGPERFEVKADLLTSFDARLPPHVIIATSTRTGCLTDLQQGCRHPERTVVGRPMNPPHLIPLVEVIAGDATSTDTVERATSLYASVGMRPVHPRDSRSGSICDRLRDAVYREALDIVAEGQATPHDVDAAVSDGYALRWARLGPLADLHLTSGAEGLLDTLERIDAARSHPTPGVPRDIVLDLHDEVGDDDPRTRRAHHDLLVEVAALKARTPHPTRSR